ncbi:PREDICTED: uncharacterized protein LOC107172594 [Diuraphis noxia]|uniref:uncharacterized protein LOC107172594 n=1 Tax=Diuraphis noxia TaxID=143948 RepID=UPI00076360F5|nr:PREDICTED: uncharacterized protein LOC107172594 [Diuraphis noxia]
MALRIAMAYRKVSTPAILVVAGTIPAHLVARERQEKYRQKWDESEKGRWTRRLIKDIDIWTNRGFGNVDFHLTQMLTGHGCFGYYLNKYKIRASSECVDCQAPVDDAEHTIFMCDRWWRERRSLEVNVGSDIGAESIVQIMLQSKRNWLAVKTFVAKSLGTKEEEERQAERRRMLN